MLSIQDFELFLHYTTETSHTLVQILPLDVWQEILPQYCFRHMFLTHALLSLAAFHLSVLREADVGEADRYRQLGTYHRACIVPRMELSFQTLSFVTDMIKASEFVVILSSIIDLLDVGTETNYDHPDVPARRQHWKMTRSLKDMIQRYLPCFSTISIHRFLEGQNREVTDSVGADIWYRPKLDTVMQVFQGYIRPDSHPTSGLNTDSLCRDYTDSINDLQKYHRDQAFGSLLLWPLFCSDQVHDALRRGEATACAMMSLYGVMLTGLGDLWYTKRGGDSLTQTVLGQNLPPELRALVAQVCKMVAT